MTVKKIKKLSGYKLRFKIPLNEFPLLGDMFFWRYEMNKIVNNFLLGGEKSMPERHLRQPGFMYNACGPISKNKEKIKKA